MKKLLSLSVLIVTLVSCNKDSNKPTFDPHAQLVLNSTDQTRYIPNAPYPIDTIIRYAWEMGMRYTQNDKIVPTRMGIPTRDLVNRKLRVGEMSAVVDIDSQTGEAKLGWFVANDTHDVVLLATFRKSDPTRWLDAHKFYLNLDLTDNNNNNNPNWAHDTIGYVPNKSLFEAQRLVKEAFAKSDYDECMRLFEEAYTFIPITGAEYRKLEEQDLN